MDRSTVLMRQLISSCYRARDDFRMAAEAVDDSNWKRLFQLYAQQRARFAEELRGHLPDGGDQDANGRRPSFAAGAESRNENWLRTCLETENRTLKLYRQALARHAFPTRTQFVVSSQLALLERVHDRVSHLTAQPSEPRFSMTTERL